MNFDGDRTRALFNYLNEKPPATAIPNLSTEANAPTNIVKYPKEEFSVFCDRTAIVEEAVPTTHKQRRITVFFFPQIFYKVVAKTHN